LTYKYIDLNNDASEIPRYHITNAISTTSSNFSTTAFHSSSVPGDPETRVALVTLNNGKVSQDVFMIRPPKILIVEKDKTKSLSVNDLYTNDVMNQSYSQSISGSGGAKVEVY